MSSQDKANQEENIDMEDNKEEFRLEKGAIHGKIGEAVMLFEQNIHPAESSKGQKQSMKIMGRGKKISTLSKPARQAYSRPITNNEMILALMNKLDSKVDEIKNQNHVINSKVEALEAKSNNTDELQRLH